MVNLVDRHAYRDDASLAVYIKLNKTVMRVPVTCHQANDGDVVNLVNEDLLHSTK